MFLFLIGLIALILGAKLLVGGAQQLARTCGISNLTIGLTIVAFGTSSPEILSCSVAAYRGEGGLVIGNLVGSNIFHLLAILGFAAAWCPPIVERKLIKLDVPILIGVCLLFWLFCHNGYIGRLEGGILCLGIVLYTLFVALNTIKEEKVPSTWPIWKDIVSIVISIFLLGFGADWLVEGATELAKLLNISPLLVGLTFMAIGTSLPELVMVIVALLKRENEIMIGGVIGSNIFNLLGVGGLSALIAPNGLIVPEEALRFDIPVMVASSIALLPIVFSQGKIDRWEGYLLFAYYLLYLSMILFKEEHSHLMSALFLFIIPITILVLTIGLVCHYTNSNK